MAKKIKSKNCERCNIEMLDVDIATRYCSYCRKIVRKETLHKHHKKTFKNKYNEEELENNFLICIIKTPQAITPKGFNEVSLIKAQSYTNYFNISWTDIVKEYGKYDQLHSYVINEFLKYKDENNSQNVKRFEKTHPYITDNITREIGRDGIRDSCDIRKLRYTEQELVDNFYEIKDLIGGVPIYSEFMRYSKISFTAYFSESHFGLNNKKYEKIVKAIVTDDEYKEYKLRGKKAKQEAGKLTGGMSATYSDEDYKNEFIRVFEYCKREYGQYPTKKLFNQLSNITESGYRGKYKKSWYELCKFYGYKIDSTSNKAEKIVLDLIKRITGVDYEPQKKWDWLRGVFNSLLFCDGFYDELNLVVEFDGRQHREPVKDFGGKERFLITQQNDKLKDKLVKEHGYTMLRISSEDPWHDIKFITKILMENNISVKEEYLQYAS
jgi:hypothetical protein